MLVVKILGKRYDKNELEQNSIIVRKWFICKQLEKEEIVGKHHVITDIPEVEKRYEDLIQKQNAETRDFYNEYLNESFQSTYPLMKDVSSFEKIRPEDGTEFCILY